MSDKVSQLLVNATFVLLVAASALTWAIVIVKALQQRRLTRQSQRFVAAFERTQGLPSASELGKHPGPVARIACAGAEAWQEGAHHELGEEPVALEVQRDLLERGLRQQLQRERRNVENGLSLLASIGSTAPFVGLFGTVLGIIHALQAISGAGSASLDVVAAPIGEALIATAVGIAVAVPAVLAYNFFVRRVKTFAGELEDFANVFVASAIKNGARRTERGVDRPRSSAVELRQEASA